MPIYDDAQKVIEELTAKKQLNDAMKGDVPMPSVNKGLASYVQNAPASYGQKSLLQLMGSGHDERSVSINLRAKGSPRSVDPEVREALLDLKKHIHSALIQAQVTARATGTQVDIKNVPFFRTHLEPLLKAYNVSDFNDWIPTLNTRFYFEELEIDPGISNLFPQHTMSSPIQNVPTISGQLMGQLETDSGTFTEQEETDGKIMLSTVNNVAHVKITEDLISDADPSVFERLRMQVAKALARSRDNAILNGDTTAPHMDTDVVNAKDFRKAWKGLRKLALDNAASVYNHAGARPNFTLFQEMYKTAGKARYDKADCLWLLGLSVEGDAVSGKIPEILTFEKAGTNATLFSGVLPSILGIRPIISDWVREDLTANAIYGAASTLTVAHLIRLAGFLFGTKSPMRIWAAPSLPSSDVMLMSAKERIAFGAAPQTSEDKYIVLGRNIATV